MRCFILCKNFFKNFLLLILNISRTGEQGDVIADIDSIVFWAEKLFRKKNAYRRRFRRHRRHHHLNGVSFPKVDCRIVGCHWRLTPSAHTVVMSHCTVQGTYPAGDPAVELVFDPSTHSPSTHTFGGLGKEAMRRASRAKKEITAWREMAVSNTFYHLSPWRLKGYLLPLPFFFLKISLFPLITCWNVHIPPTLVLSLSHARARLLIEKSSYHCFYTYYLNCPCLVHNSHYSVSLGQSGKPLGSTVAQT